MALRAPMSRRLAIGLARCEELGSGAHGSRRRRCLMRGSRKDIDGRPIWGSGEMLVMLWVCSPAHSSPAVLMSCRCGSSHLSSCWSRLHRRILRLAPPPPADGQPRACPGVGSAARSQHIGPTCLLRPQVLGGHSPAFVGLRRFRSPLVVTTSAGETRTRTEFATGNAGGVGCCFVGQSQSSAVLQRHLGVPSRKPLAH